MGEDSLTARWDATHDCFLLSDGTRVGVNNKYGVVVAPKSLLDRIDLASLVAAAGRDLGPWHMSSDDKAHERRYPGGDLGWTVWPDPSAGAVVVETLTAPREVDWSVLAGIDWDATDPEAAQEAAFETDRAPWREGLERLLSPLVARVGGHMSVEFEFEGDSHEHGRIRVAMPATGRTGKEASQAAEQILALLDATQAGRLWTLSAARDLVATGHLQALVGQEEGQWFDAKRAPHDVSTDPGKAEFAKDVAAFANSGGGLILIGARTRRTADGERVISVVPVPLERFNPTQLRMIVRSRVHPVVSDLEIRTVDEVGGVGVGFIYIPPQEEWLRPFLVRGVATRRGVREEQIGIPVRVSDATQWIDVATAHAWMTAGRLALAGLTPQPTRAEVA